MNTYVKAFPIAGVIIPIFLHMIASESMPWWPDTVSMGIAFGAAALAIVSKNRKDSRDAAAPLECPKSRWPPLDLKLTPLPKTGIHERCGVTRYLSIHKLRFKRSWMTYPILTSPLNTTTNTRAKSKTARTLSTCARKRAPVTTGFAQVCTCKKLGGDARRKSRMSHGRRAYS